MQACLLLSSPSLLTLLHGVVYLCTGVFWCCQLEFNITPAKKSNGYIVAENLSTKHKSHQNIEGHTWDRNTIKQKNCTQTANAEGILEIYK
jgi:hypothetical protein